MALTVLLVSFAAGPALAEVLDKEPTIDDVWHATATCLVLALFATWLVHRWLMVLTFGALFARSAATFAWTEWHDEYVGPALRAEAGLSYGKHVHAAMVVALAGHLFFWWIGRLQSAKKQEPRVEAMESMLEARRSLVFSGLLFAGLVIAAHGGFGAGPDLWWSPPMLLQAGVVVATAMLWQRRKTRLADQGPQV